MKKLMIVIFIVILLITGCGTKTETNILNNNNLESKTFTLGEKKIELEKRTFLSNKASILIPKDFENMSEEMAKLKYPSEKRPQMIFTNKEGSINIAFTHTNSKTTNEQIPEYQKSTKDAFENLYPSASWYSDGIEIINGKNVGKLELLSPALDTKIYNLLFMAELDNRLLLITFNTTEENMDDWKPIAQDIMKSLTLAE